MRRPVWTFKSQGAAGLLASIVGALVAVSVPASFQNGVDGGAAPPTQHGSTAKFGSLHSAPASQLMRAVPSPLSGWGSRSFHTVDQPAPSNSLSGGALGMMLLGLFSLALFVAALLLRGQQPQNDR